MPRGVYPRRKKISNSSITPSPFSGVDLEFQRQMQQKRPEGILARYLNPETGWPKHQFPPDPDPGDGGIRKLDHPSWLQDRGRMPSSPEEGE